MARSGVTQQQINATADALLRAGERPTIERVRHALGTGSPNTLIRLLDVWWLELGQRLSAQELKLTLPDAPRPVAEAANALWSLALEHASGLAEARLEDERLALSLAQARSAEAIASSQAIADHAQREAQRAHEAQGLAESRLTDIQRLVEALELQLKELHAQRELMASELGAMTRRAQSAEETLTTQATASDARREALEAQHRASERRWMQEVDRARQETLKVQSVLKRADVEAASQARQAAEALRELQSSLDHAARAQAASRATVTALETEVARIHQQLAASRRPKAPSPRKRPKARIVE